MFKEILVTLRWSISLGVKFFRVVPYYTFTIVMLTLVAQLSALLSSFLPLKVIILLGSEGMPRYFPASFQAIDRDLLVVLLSTATVGFFLLTLVANKLIDLVTASASEKLLAKSHKLTLFENQDQVAANGYQKYSSALAGMVFVGLALLGIGYFYPSMSLVLIAYSASVFALLLLLSKYVVGFVDYLENSLSFVVGVASNLGFFFAFAYLVLEFVLWTPPGFIVVIVSLLLSRQVFSRINGFVTGVAGLSKQKQKLDVLFFHGKQLAPASMSSKQKSIWSYLMPEHREAWLCSLVSETADQQISNADIKIKWLDSGQPNIAHFLVLLEGKDDLSYLIKLYEKNRTALASHEASLLLDASSRLPAPRLLLVTELEKLACHVYELQHGVFLGSKISRDEETRLSHCLPLFPLPDSLKNRYKRSRPLIADRLTEKFIERVKVVANDKKQERVVDKFVHSLPQLRDKLSKLPLVIVNPTIKNGVWKEKKTESCLAISWEKWSIEPLGAGIAPRDIDDYIESLEKEGDVWFDVSKVEKDSIRLSAQAMELERLLNKQQMNVAFNQVKRMQRLLSANE